MTSAKPKTPYTPCMLCLLLAGTLLLAACEQGGKQEEQEHIPIAEHLEHFTKTAGILSLGDRFVAEDTLRLYSADGTLWHAFSFVYDDSDGQYDFAKADFRPYAFHPDYFELALQVIAQDSLHGLVQVIVNHGDSTRKYLDCNTNRGLRFMTVEDYIAASTLAVSLKTETAPRDTIEGETLALILPANKAFPMELVKGDWMRLRIDSAHTGWVQWRQNDTLLVHRYTRM